MEKQERAVAPGWWHSLVPLNYGWEACQPGHTFGPAARHYHLLHFVLKGEGAFLKGGEWHQVGPGDLFVILPEEITTYCASLTDPWEYVWISFLASETPAFLEGAVIRQPPVYKIFERLRDLCLQDPEDGKIFAVLYDLLDRLSRDAPVSARRDAYAAYAKAYLETMYMQPVSIQQIADTLHIDRRYLTALFRQAYGQSPKAYLTELRLDQAKSFLRQGHSVTEASSMAGFPDLSNFSRQYKRRFGSSPSGRPRLSAAEKRKG